MKLPCHAGNGISVSERQPEQSAHSLFCRFSVLLNDLQQKILFSGEHAERFTPRHHMRDSLKACDNRWRSHKSRCEWVDWSVAGKVILKWQPGFIEGWWFELVVVVEDLFYGSSNPSVFFTVVNQVDGSWEKKMAASENQAETGPQPLTPILHRNVYHSIMRCYHSVITFHYNRAQFSLSVLGFSFTSSVLSC